MQKEKAQSGILYGIGVGPDRMLRYHSSAVRTDRGV